MNDLIERTPGIIAAEIYSIKGQARNVILLSSIEIGKRLVEAKDLIPHGEWGKWLEDSVEYSQSTANNLMQLYREYGEDTSKFPTLGNLSYTKALALLSVPQEERGQFAKENDLEKMSAKELKQVIKDKQELEQKLKDSESRAKKEKAAREKLSKEIKELQLQNEDNSKAVTRLKSELKSAKEAGNDEEIKQLQETLTKANQDLQHSKEKISSLEKQLKEKPIEVPAVIEKVPESIEKELEDLRQQVSQQVDQASIKFRLRFESLVDEFKNLLTALEEMTDTDQALKYKKAVSGLIEKMQERL